MDVLEDEIDGRMEPDGSEAFPVKSCRDVKMYHPESINGTFFLLSVSVKG